MSEIALEPYGKHPHSQAEEDVYPATASPADSFDEDEVKQVQARDYDPRYDQRDMRRLGKKQGSSRRGSSIVFIFIIVNAMR
jgi:hypothetical protein